MTKYIGIIDYKAGNSPSVLNALQRLNIEARLLAAPENAGDIAGIILPGVGSARATMDSLRENGWIDFLNDRVYKNGLPFLGICVGLQVLFEHSEEGGTDCLGWLKGKVKRFDDKKVRVPHIGWNGVKFSAQCTMRDAQVKDDYFYFVNSYYAVPKDGSIVWAHTDYDGAFCSAVRYKNITATQFHLEKSGEAGLAVLKEFAERALT
ncbi:imidazole glycerol phosphate synthase subunit HisH [Clostridia bacterium]|nr:imidazole glycerol phosphate synthase subunit HisH [Clostridia bacterium]